MITPHCSGHGSRFHSGAVDITYADPDNTSAKPLTTTRADLRGSLKLRGLMPEGAEQLTPFMSLRPTLKLTQEVSGGDHRT